MQFVSHGYGAIFHYALEDHEQFSFVYSLN